MFGSLGGPEILLIFVLALLIFGPRKLPEIGRTVGKTLAEFRKATFDFRSSLEREVELEKIKEAGSSVRSAVADTAGSVRRAVRIEENGSAPTPPGPSSPPASSPPVASPPSDEAPGDHEAGPRES